MALRPSMMTWPCGVPRHLPNTTTGRSPSTSGSCAGSTSYTSRPSKRSFTLVSTGDSISLRKRSACALACDGWVMMKGSPMPARARPSIRWRFTDEPMPNENRLACDRLRRTSSNASRSTVTKPSLTTTTVRDTSAALGSAYTRLSAGISSVPPPPPISSMVRTACSILACVAGTDWGLRKRLLPENSSTLKVSLGRSLPISSRIKVLAVSSGKPCIEPEISTTKM